MNRGLKYDADRKWIIEVTERQLYDIIDAVEDVTRFLAGQTQLANATSYVNPCKNMHELRYRLRDLKPLVTPHLDRGESYAWNGGDCPDEEQREAIKRGYATYRNLRHCIEKYRDNDYWNVYQSETLTCGVPLAVCYPKTEENGTV